MIDFNRAFPKSTVRLIECGAEQFQLKLVDFPEKRVQLLMTNGLSNYAMPVHEKYAGREHIELYFCLPSYWEIDNKDARFQWPIEWIEKLGNHLMNKGLWFGPGHTIEPSNGLTAFSETMKQNHLILLDPILMQEELTPIAVDGFKVHFLSIIPIFSDEMDYKQAKGTYKLQKKFRQKGITEKLDDFRSGILKSRMRFF